MIPGLEEYDAVVLHDIDDPVFEAQPPGPDIRADVFEGLRLPKSSEGVVENVQNQVENSDRVFFIILDPKLEVPKKLWPEGQLTLFYDHRPSRRAAS